MTLIIHQIWLGGEPPGRYRPWLDSMQELADRLGFRRTLWTQEGLAARFAGTDAALVLQRLERVPVGVFGRVFAADWYRWAVLAEYGGWYADADMRAADIDRVAAWTPSADISFSNEYWDKGKASSGLIICKGERGHAAAQVAFHVCTARLLALLPPDAADFGARFVGIARAGLADAGLGPEHLRCDIIPTLTAAGFTCDILPRRLYADANRRKARPAIQHMGAGEWTCAADWARLMRAAERADRRYATERERARLAALPVPVRPQGAAALPGRGFTPAAAVFNPRNR